MIGPFLRDLGARPLLADAPEATALLPRRRTASLQIYSSCGTCVPAVEALVAAEAVPISDTSNQISMW